MSPLNFGTCRTSRRRFLVAVPCFAAAAGAFRGLGATSDPGRAAYVRVSQKDPRYFELTDGSPYIPIGLNMIAPPGNEGLPGMERWMRSLASNGGNFIRVWLSNPFFEVEHEKAGDFDEAKAARIRELLKIAGRNGIRVKMCIEHFRHLGEGRQTWAGKPLHHVSKGGTARDIADWFNGEASRAGFQRKLSWLAERFADEPAVFGWELWNEVNAVSGGDYLAWTEAMLPELRRRFPRHLVMQSLGSYDSDYARKSYARLPGMKGNDVAQVHRYLDLGAPYEICHAPMDVLAADAVGELLGQRPGKPVLLAESGGVEPKHSGPLLLYAKDKQGMLLHDVLFAPFFSGAAGPGHIWHWDAYVAKMNLWWQFGRFAEAVRGIDCAEEAFAPRLITQDPLRVYVLQGRKTALLWCRDTRNTWKTELVEGTPPAEVAGFSLDLSSLFPEGGKREVEFYDPWTEQRTSRRETVASVSLPQFRRSLAVKIPRQNATG